MPLRGHLAEQGECADLVFKKSFLSTCSDDIAIPATCPDNVSTFLKYNDTSWVRVVANDTLRKRVVKIEIYRHGGGWIGQ